MPNLYRNESGHPQMNAQINLRGRTYYAEPDTLKFHHSRILRCAISDGGLLLGLVESCALDMHNTKRGYRAIVFDIFGTAIYRPNLDDCVRTKARAEKLMWEAMNATDAHTVTLEGIGRAERNHAAEMEQLSVDMAKLVADGKVRNPHQTKVPA